MYLFETFVLRSNVEFYNSYAKTPKNTSNLEHYSREYHSARFTGGCTSACAANIVVEKVAKLSRMQAVFDYEILQCMCQ